MFNNRLAHLYKTTTSLDYQHIANTEVIGEGRLWISSTSIRRTIDLNQRFLNGDFDQIVLHIFFLSPIFGLPHVYGKHFQYPEEHWPGLG